MKFHAILLASIIIASLVGLSNFDNAFAEHVEYVPIEEMEKIDVKVLFVNSFGECTMYQWDRVDTYAFIAKDYLWKYNIVANVWNNKECINVDDEKLTVEESYLSNDLTIIIPDEVGTIERLYDKGFGGYYHVQDDPKKGELRGNRYIVSTSEAVDAESEWSVWVLSHELSHFALEWYGYPIEVWGGDGPPKSEVHLRDEAYNRCISKDATGEMCTNLWELVESVVTPGEAYATGKKYHVMEPLRSERYVSPSTSALPSQTSNCDVFSCYGGKVVGFVNLPQYTVNGIKNNNSNLKEGDQLCVKYFLNYASKDLKERYAIPYEKIKVGKTILNAFGEPLTNTQFNYYTVTESGNFEICRSLKMYSESYWKNGYKYEVFFEGNSKYAANQGPSLTLFFKLDPSLDIVPVTPQQPTPVTPQQPKITKYDFDGDGIPDDKDTCRKKPEDYNGYIDWDGCPDKKQFLELKDSEYQKQMELEREKKKQERAEIHKKNVEILQKQEQEKESQILRDEFLGVVKDVEKGVEVSEKSLTGLVFQKKEAQEKINTAWDYLKENKKRINALHNYYLKNIDKHIEGNYLDGVKREINRAENSAEKVVDNLEKVSILIEDAKQLEKQKFCFLFWCW